ncbi:MAG: hypothetical protein COB20_04320 [SAR86 cluster bacterium]|uniref:Collagen-like protein n=1 Tax=SAR86 cluster bacterium TaxID=2030880 RepID=A0A2A4XAU7_9GAMM|nr:MAG: hypothetical protein COB20_04320 [SAR86 cluster bacterium]
MSIEKTSTHKNLLYRYFPQFIFMTFLIAATPASIMAQQAIVSGDQLSVPAVAVGDDFYRVELRLINTDPIELQIELGEQIFDVSGDNIATFSGNTLSIPMLVLNGVSYSADFNLVSEDPAIFRQTRLDILGQSSSWIGAATAAIQGERGEVGPEGPAGPRGPAGSGSSGGPAGPQGATGPTGPAGTAGAVGAAGPAGTAGLAGTVGAAGPQGNPGPAGAAGLQGSAGSAGAQGLTGATGAPGPQGPAGSTGAQGPQGPAGATGTQGATGTTGATGAAGGSSHSGAIYRWSVFSSYDQNHGWIGANSGSFFGGIQPSNWTDNGATVDSLGTIEELQTLFTKKGYASKNALIIADTWTSVSSTNGKMALALFRIKNTTSSAILWPVTAHHTSYHGWGERASVALNGTSVWDSGSSNINSTAVPQTHNLLIPANSTSTAIFASGSTAPGTNSRTVFLAFSGDSLLLPAGLEYVDDLDVATAYNE